MDDYKTPDSQSSLDDSLPDASSNNGSEGIGPAAIPTESSVHTQTHQTRDLSEHRKTVISEGKAEQSHPKKQTSTDVGRTLQGAQLEHFHLEEFVGGGGMGAVFRATDQKLGRTVAVKVLSRNRKDGDSLRRFKNEAQSAARLDHPNIARVFYVGEDAGWNFIVFEYISGINIRDLVSQRGPLSLQDCWSYVLQVADALTHAAERDIVHRDIKPSNILVTLDGTAKLVDMGLARFHQLDSDNSDATASGVTLGTFDYISPEQARDPRNTDVRGDIYSLGCTLYYMLTGRAPYPAGTVLQKLLSHSGDPVPDPRAYREELDDGTVRILHKMLAKQPSTRYQTPNELIDDITSVGEHLGLSLSHPGRVWVSQITRPQFSLTKHMPWIAPLLILLISALTLTQIVPNAPPLIVAEPTFSNAPYVVPKAEKNNTQGTSHDDVASSDVGSRSVTIDTEEDVLPLIKMPSAIGDADTITLFVGPHKSPLKSDQLAVDTFSDAIALVETNPSISIVELNGNYEISSFALRLLGRQSQPITFRSSESSRSVIGVQLTAVQLETNSPRFFHFSYGNISFENIGFRFYLSPEFRQQWSIFQLDGVVSLRFDDVDISVVPAVTDNRYIQIAVFDYAASPTINDAAEGDSRAIARQPVTLDLTNCVIRGPVNFLRATPSQQINATWRNGLFASSDWFLQLPSIMEIATDADLTRDAINSPISLTVELQQLVVSATPGILRVYNDALGATRGRPPVIDFTMTKSIFVPSPGNSIVEIDQISTSEEPRYRPTMRGSDNCYQNTTLMLLERDRDDIMQTTQLTLGELTVDSGPTDGNDWFQQENILSNNNITWQATPVPPITTPDYLQAPHHYQLLDYRPESPGFDYQLLPVMK